MAETGPPSADSKEPQASRLPRWFVVLAALVLAGVVVGVIVYGYTTRPGWVGVSDKKFWDYLELLIVPAALAIGVYWLNRAQQEREREADEAQQRRERKAEEDRTERERLAEAVQRERELEIENQRTQDEALQTYLDRITQLLTDKDRPLYRAQLGDRLSTVARARTLTVLARLDGDRKQSVVRFLYESDLITKDRRILDLQEANLRRADLRGVGLRQSDLSYADLRAADLSDTSLSGALCCTGPT